MVLGVPGGYIAFDAAGVVYVSGYFGGTADFYRSGNQPGVPGLLTSAGESDGFILKLSSDGSLAAAQKIGGPFSDNAIHIAVDSAAGRLYCTGSFQGAVAFGDNMLTSAGGDDVFLTSLRMSDLNILSAYRAGGVDRDWGGSVAIDSTGLLYNAGVFSSTADFPTGDVRTSAGLLDVFLMKFNPDRGSISGNVFADLDGQGDNDDGVATPPGTIVYCDLDNDTTRDSNEPSAVTKGASGAYAIVNLDYDDGAGGSVTYAVRQDALPAGWSQTYPAGGAAQPVTLSPTSKNATGKDFGNDFTTETKSGPGYENKTKYSIKDNSVVSSKITVADSYAILDLNVTVNITHSNRADLKVELIAPDGTTILLANTGAYPAPITTFDDEGTYRPAQPLTES